MLSVNTFLLPAGIAVAALSMPAVALAQAAAESKEPIRLNITVTPVPGSLSDFALPITVVEDPASAAPAGGSLGDLLATEPGIATSTFAPGASRPIIRGLDNVRVRIQENGIGAHDVSAVSEDHGVPIDPLTADRIEIIRGPATLRYGSEAIGGVVNVLTNRIPLSLPSDGIDGTLFGAWSSVDEGMQGALEIDAGANGVAVHFDAFGRNAEEYEIPESPGYVDGSEVEAFGYSGGASIIGNRGLLGASVSRYESEYGIPATEDPLFIDLERTQYALTARAETGLTLIEAISLDLGYTDYTHDEIEDATGDVGSTFENDEIEGRLEARHGSIVGLSGVIGFAARNRDLEASGEGGELIAPSDTTALAAYIFEELVLSRAAKLQVAARIEEVEVDGTGFSATSLAPATVPGTDEEFSADRSFTLYNASAGVVFDLGRSVSLGFNAQVAQRAPDALELFAKGPHEATETFEIGDADLDKETAYGLEATLKRNTERASFDVAVFYTRFDNFIYKAFTGNSCDDDFATCEVGDALELTQILYTQQDAEFWGAEASAEAEVTKVGPGAVWIDGRFDVVRAEFDDGENVPRIPPLRIGAGISYVVADLARADDRLRLRAGFLDVAEQDRLSAFETETDGYTTLDASIVYTLPLDDGGRVYEIGIVGNNLTDEEARNHVSFKKEEVLLPGRDIRVFGKVSF